MDSSKNRKAWPGLKRWVGRHLSLVVAVVIVGSLIGMFSTFWVGAGHLVWRFLRYSWPVLLLLVTAGALAAKADSNSYHIGHRGKPTGLIVAAVVAALVMVPTIVFASQSALWSASNATVVADAEVLSFDARAPYMVAASASDRFLGDTTGDSIGTLTFLQAEQRYTTLVVRRGFVQGYESIQTMSLPLIGTATTQDVSFCQFSEQAGRRIGGGWFTNSLTMAVLMRTSASTMFAEEDVFAVCDDGTPKVYVPLTRLKGVFAPIKVPAGVAVYDGSTGQLEIVGSMQDARLPVYPLSLARAQRESSKAGHGLWDWVFGKAGWENTNVDTGDPNGGNRAEFSLGTTSGGVYVTPLTPRGSSSSIVALSTIGQDATTKDKLTPITIHAFPAGQSRLANSTVAHTITTTTLSGYKAAGLQVFEIVPGEDGKWIASIGSEQTILYRALIGLDGSVVLTGSSDPADPGAGTTPAGHVTLDKPISQMTADELLVLGQELGQLVQDTLQRLHDLGG